MNTHDKSLSFKFAGQDARNFDGVLDLKCTGIGSTLHHMSLTIISSLRDFKRDETQVLWQSK